MKKCEQCNKEFKRLDVHQRVHGVYKVILKSIGRVFEAEGKTLEDALNKIKISNGARVVSVLQVKRGKKERTKILSGMTTHNLFSYGSPTTKLIYLNKVKSMFDI